MSDSRKKGSLVQKGSHKETAKTKRRTPRASTKDCLTTLFPQASDMFFSVEDNSVVQDIFINKRNML